MKSKYTLELESIKTGTFDLYKDIKKEFLVLKKDSVVIDLIPVDQFNGSLTFVYFNNNDVFKVMTTGCKIELEK